MSELYSTYKHEFNFQIHELTDLKSPELKEEAIDSFKKKWVMAEHKFKMMELEAMGDYEREKQCKIERLRLDELNKWVLMHESKQLEQKAKEELFSDAKNKRESENQIKANMAVYSQNEKLRDATKNMLDTENTAIEIEGLLHGNSETLKRSLNRTQEISNEFGFANRIISQIEKRMVRNRIMFYGTFACLLVGLIIVLFSYVF